jgi:hypothetical protein
MKHGLFTPEHLIALKQVAELAWHRRTATASSSSARPRR